ncbi:hypothetical protein L873DRAFT_1411070 [Choiromyces venosus 120613-1]|uniref:Uncharacterized protein n=1 Tax=Choiromyces venosus 120613-1 TaxID=1336337 RepID=A0A3N4J8G0_9PEZI|nr:hypothetical protein L873DRAFT_1411070 [Choiromyces venosus 120613-1]
MVGVWLSNTITLRTFIINKSDSYIDPHVILYLQYIAGVAFSVIHGNVQGNVSDVIVQWFPTITWNYYHGGRHQSSSILSF